jgi:hypothetical protein
MLGPDRNALKKFSAKTECWPPTASTTGSSPPGLITAAVDKICDECSATSDWLFRSDRSRLPYCLAIKIARIETNGF